MENTQGKVKSSTSKLYLGTSVNVHSLHFITANVYNLLLSVHCSFLFSEQT